MEEDFGSIKLIAVCADGKERSLTVKFSTDPRLGVTESMRELILVSAKAVAKTAILSLESMVPKELWDETYNITRMDLPHLEACTGIQIK